MNCIRGEFVIIQGRCTFRLYSLEPEHFKKEPVQTCDKHTLIIMLQTTL